MRILGLPLGSLGTKSHLDVAPVERCIVYHKGEGGDFPQVWTVVNLVSPNCLWLVLAPKVLQLCTNHLVLVFCRFVWVVEAFQFFLVSSWSSNMPFYPSKVLWAKERAPIPYSSIVFNLDSHLSPQGVVDLVESFPTVWHTLPTRQEIESIPNFYWSGVKLPIWLPTFLLIITCVSNVQMSHASPF